MATSRYNLDGTYIHPQVEPRAGFWLRCPVPHTIRLRALVNALGSQIKPFPAASEPGELAELQQLYTDRNNPVPGLSRLLSDPIFFNPPPAGAAVTVPVQNGKQLAQLFKAETPGLWHRHVLNVLLPKTDWSPPRQALVWASLDVAIHSALAAAWHFKWVAADGISFRHRPYEYARDHGIPFTVLFDSLPPPAPDLTESPGTPRHPAYPSGHSTYSAAASRVLGCLFKGYQDPRPELAGIDWEAQFGLLADNIGLARLYGGVHWRSDHSFGQTVGHAVGDLIIEQLNRSGIQAQMERLTHPPKVADLRDQADEFERRCGENDEHFCGKFGAPPPQH